MAESLFDFKHIPKADAYRQAGEAIDSLLDGVDDPVAAMATMASVLHNGFGFLWTGFYRVVSPGLLRVGPYQGSVGCLDIAFGKGVCGTAASDRRTIIVPDVNLFPGHITCDARARSEIVIPVSNRGDELIAVLDVDSEHPSMFDAGDQHGLERVVAWFSK
ncbi:MAG TPA: GAF domain-containing protein [Gemmatimonadaceae bacterium]|nr:GAF domain-containing protein [Gemmatimonadaceae bacterium]